MAFALAFLCAAANTAGAQGVASLAANGAARPGAKGRAAESRPAGGVRRIASLRAADGAAGGSRVVVTSDSALDGYTSYREGARFYVLVPRADASAVSSAVAAGDGFADARVERRGADVLLSFALAPGVAARVRQNFNRLEVVFAAQPQQQGGAQNPPASPPATSDSSTTREKVGAAKVAAGSGRAVVVPPEKAQAVRVPRLDKVPVIDGKLDDEVWKGAARFKDFIQIQPGDNLPPSHPTEMMMGYDSKTLYIAVRAWDEPGKVRATIPKRDGIFGDDYVGVYLDTFNDRRKAYALFFSPLGVQADGIYTEGQGEDYSLDIVMESKGALVPDGYVIEAAIPFKSLRYEAGKDKVWNVQLFRRVQHLNSELDSWMPISRDISGTLNQAGRITGLEGISTERTLEVIPSLTLSETGRHVRALPPVPFGAPRTTPDPGRLVNQPLDYDVGVTAKYTLTPTVTLDFAYNPDFAQVEADPSS
ncbi:MAG: carbohydrate binding family 9 domain-containing protein [Acidobacteria bacterium]|nr:carbohydrate binding family 9 domain-containing protein [Acidobacteriota bacterium]